MQHIAVPTDPDSPELVGIGVSVWDSVMKVKTLPEKGGVVQAVSQCDSLGGGITVAMAVAARLGTKVAMIDCLGDDLASENILHSLQQSGVDCHAIHQRAGDSGSLASIWTDSVDAERTIVFSPGTACDQLIWSAEIESMVRSARAVHFNGRHLDVCSQAIRVAKRNGTKVSFDGGAHRYRDEIVPLLIQADIAIVAKQFAAEHWKRRSNSNASSQDSLHIEQLSQFMIRDLECEIAGVTDGIHGSVLVHRDGTVVKQNAIELDLAIDTTGCGDTYHGAFLHAYLSGNSLEEAALQAASEAAKTSQHLGGFRLK